MSDTPFEIINPSKNKKSGSKGIIVALFVILFLILSAVTAVYFIGKNQNPQEKAAANLCPAVEACPYPSQPGLLRNCHPQEVDGTPSESLCNLAGRIEFCGTKNFCCPVNGGAWTPDMTKCATPKPTPTPTPIPGITPYTQAEVATHSTTSNCWLIISNKIYNVTSFLVSHPGGIKVIEPYCGKEATQAFETRGGKGSTHSNTARNMLPQYQIGVLTGSSGGGIQCNGSCTSSSQCSSGYVCYITSGATGTCRNSSCTSQISCVCPTKSPSPIGTPTKTPTSTASPTKSPSPTPVSSLSPTPSHTPSHTPSPSPTLIAQISTASPTPVATQATPIPIPETGTNWPTIFGTILGIVVIGASLIFAI